MSSMPRKNAAKHGGSGKYRTGCRCDECREGHNKRMAAYYERKRQEREASGDVPTCYFCGDRIKSARSARPACKPCKGTTPLWRLKGHPDPRVDQAHRMVVAQARREAIAARPKRDMRSDVRAGYEDGDYERFIKGIRARVITTVDGCWEWQGRINKGYPEATLGKRYMQVHRMVLEAREGAPLGVLAAHHICANSGCVNPNHLQPVTQRENTAEMQARTSLEARINELEDAVRKMSPNHSVLNRISHTLAA